MARKHNLGSKYTAELGAQICDRLAQGEPLLSITRSLGIPYTTAGDWERDIPAHAENSRRARERGCHALADECVMIANTPEVGEVVTTKPTGDEIRRGDMIEHRRLKIDTRMRLIGKWLPKVYGDKQHLEHSGELTISDRLARAEAQRKA